MKKLFLTLFLCSCTTTQVVTPNPTPIVAKCNQLSVGNFGSLNGFQPIPTASAWIKDISNEPIDPQSDYIIKGDGTYPGLSTNRLHPDFGSVSGGNYGIPYTVVDSNMIPLVPIDVKLYPEESDVFKSPIPIDAAIEGTPADCTDDGWDRHLIVLDKNTCEIHELYQANRCNGKWSASSTAKWSMIEDLKRPVGWTSADAAGLSIFAGLIRYDEIEAGEIKHALRFTVQHTKTGPKGSYFVDPATHGAGGNWGTPNIMGMRLRLKADFDISNYSKTNQIILKAMKKYGMILADNGSNMFFSGVPSPKWNDDDLNKLKNINAYSFEVVKMGEIKTAN